MGGTREVILFYYISVFEKKIFPKHLPYIGQVQSSILFFSSMKCSSDLTKMFSEHSFGSHYTYPASLLSDQLGIFLKDLASS